MKPERECRKEVVKLSTERQKVEENSVMANGESTRSQVTEELIRTLKKKAKNAPVIARARRRSWLTKGDAVLAIRSEIEAMMKEKGYSYRDVSRWMTENGVAVTAQQVSTALRKAGKSELSDTLPTGSGGASEGTASTADSSK